MRRRRSFSKRQKIILTFLSGGVCAICGVRLEKNFHGDHKEPYSKGGETLIRNGQALCAPCNLKKGDKI